MRLIPLLALALGCRSESKVDPLDDGSEEVVDETPEAEDPVETTGELPEGTLDNSGLGGAIPGDAVIETDELPDDYVYEEDAVEPELSLDDVQAGIEDGLWTYFWVDPAMLHDLYRDLTSVPEADVISGAADCPYYYDYYYTDYGYFYWYDTCSTDDGTGFSGYALSYDYAGLVSGGYTYPEYGYISASGAVTSPAGATLDLAGYSYMYEYDYGGSYGYHYNYIYGNFSYDGEGYEDTWLAAGLSLNLYTSAFQYNNTETPNLYVQFSGSLAGMTGAVNTIVFVDTYFHTAAMGSNCDAEPSGTISVRGSDGEWYDVEFQGPPYMGSSVFPTDCDGCGQVYFRGEYLGDVCPDFSALSDWENRPW